MFIDQLENYFQTHITSPKSIIKANSENVFLSQKKTYMIKDQEITNLLKSKLLIDKTEKIEKIFKMVDRNKDNFIDQDEFIKLIKIIEQKIQITDILSLFTSLDYNKDGRISYLEFFKSMDIEDPALENSKLLAIQLIEKNYEENDKKSFKILVQNILRYYFL